MDEQGFPRIVFLVVGVSPGESIRIHLHQSANKSVFSF